jgi:hypothetical protein
MIIVIMIVFIILPTKSEVPEFSGRELEPS